MVAAASASESLKTYKFRVFTGPVDVREVASRLRSDGIDAHDGTEHVWGKVSAPSRLGAIDRVNAAARFPLAGWNDFRLDESINELAHTEEETGDPSAMPSASESHAAADCPGPEADVIRTAVLDAPPAHGPHSDSPKRWISAVVASGDVTKEQLLAAHRQGVIILSRSDLDWGPGTDKLWKRMRERSEIKYLNAEYHFVEIPCAPGAGAGAREDSTAEEEANRRHFGHRDLSHHEETYQGYLLETDGRSVAQKRGDPERGTYSYTSHGAGGRHGSGFIFYTRAEAVAAGRARINEERMRAEMRSEDTDRFLSGKMQPEERNSAWDIEPASSREAVTTHSSAEDRRPVRKEETYLGYLLETEGLHSDKHRTETKYSYTTHGPGGRHSSGFIFYSRAEAQAAGRGRLIEEHHKNMNPKNDGAREAVTTHSGAITWHLDGDVYRGQGRLGSYTVEPAHKRGKKGGGWVALRGTKLLGWGEFHDDAIRMADAHDERAPEAPVRVVVHEVGETFDYDEHWKKDEAARAGILSEWHTDKKFQLPSEYNLQHLHWEHTLWRVERRLWGDKAEREHAHEHPEIFAVDAKTEEEARAAVDRWTHWKFVGDWTVELTVARWPIHNGRPVPITWPDLEFDFEAAKRRPQTGRTREARGRREAWPESERASEAVDGWRNSSSSSATDMFIQYARSDKYPGVERVSVSYTYDEPRVFYVVSGRTREYATPEGAARAAAKDGVREDAAEAGPGGALEWRERGDVWTARWAGADYRIEPDGSDLVVTYAGRRIGRAGTLGAAMGMATRHTNEASGYRDPMAAENVPVVHEIVTGEVREEGDPLQPAPYSKKNLWEKDGGTMLQPYKGGWIVEVRGAFMGSVKKLKSGWKIDPLGKTTSGMAYEACKRATELLDAHFAHHSSATEASAPHEAGLAQDFGSPDAAVQHAGGNGATHYATRGSKTYVFWPAFGGRYVEKRVYASHGKWHIDKDYDGVAKLPKGAKKIDVPYETSASEKVSVLHEGPVSTAAEAAASEQREAVTIEHPAAKDICIPWVKVERDPERYATCLATARKIGPIDSPKKMYELLAGTMNKEDTEIFVVVLCDVRGQLRGVCEVARGQRSKVSVGVNDVLRVVLVSGAELFMCAHLHPTGSSPSSKSDKDLTRDIEEACKPFKSEITFADHVVIGMGEVTSIKEGKTYPMNQRAAHRKGKPYMPALAAKPD